MKTIILISTIVLLAANAIATSPPWNLLRCSDEGEGWKSTLTLNEDGYSALVLDGKAGKFECKLSLKELETKEGARVPNLRLQFKRAHCKPDNSTKVSGTILDDITLIIDYPNSKQPHPIYQWLQHTQPGTCKLEKFENTVLADKANQFKNGGWGK